MFIIESWKCAEWCHLLVSLLGVLLLRKYHLFVLGKWWYFGVVLLLGILYEYVVYKRVGYAMSVTDMVADFLGCLLGVLL